MSTAVTEKIAVSTATAQAPSLVSRIAGRYNVEPAKLLSTLKATAFYSAEGEITNEQMMALLIVADQYRLNPFTKEIYAFVDKKRGGIVPIVGVDGWSRIVNEQPEFDGVEFIDGPASDKHKNAPEWIECIMHRKDRTHPTRIRERLIECFRDTGPWGSHPARFLRHKAFMQCARIAFAFVGIYDEDEAQRIIAGEVVNGREDNGSIASLNKSIRGKTTIEGEAQRVEPDASAGSGQQKTAAAQGSAAPLDEVFSAPAAATVEPTAIDAIAAFVGIGNIDKLDEYMDALPVPVKQEERVAKKFKERRDELKDTPAKGKK